MNSQTIFHRAFTFHQQGKLAEAEPLYLQVLAAEPANFAARHLLGVLRHQQERNAEALELIGEALKINPGFVEARSYYGTVLNALGRHDEAVLNFDKALALKPDFTVALNNRGLALRGLNRHQDALASFDRALAIKPDYFQALNNHGATLLHLHQFEEALTSFDRLLTAMPDYAEALHDRGLALQGLGRFEEALASFDKALMAKPGYVLALNNRANILHLLGRIEESLADFDKVLAAKPDHFDALNNRGLSLARLDRFAEAVASYDRALAVTPDHVETLLNRSAALEQMGRLDDALASHDKAIAMRPDYAPAFLARGLVLRQLNRPGEAVRSYDRALMVQPDFFDAHFQRGIALDDLGHGEQALASYDRAIALKPDSFAAIHNRCWALVRLRRFTEAARGFQGLEELAPGNAQALNGRAYCAIQLCDWSHHDEFLERLRGQILQKNPDIQLGTLIGYNDDPALQLAAAQNRAAAIVPPAGPPLQRARPFSHPKIRLAYCSADFMSHPVSRLLAGMFENHDRNQFEVIAISFAVDDKSEIRSRLTRAFDQFHHVLDASDYDIAALIAGLGVDIAVDLMGYTTRARTGIFALRPAPVQVNYMGYPSTMGTAFHDYIIADRIVLPADQQAFYSEKIIHLPDTYYGTDGTRAAAGLAPSRAVAGLPDNGFVFCCFNNNWKISQPQFDIWMRLLKAVPGSVLWLLHDNDEVVASLKRHAAERGVTPERLVFAARVSQEDHLARHRLADLFLDTLPYNAHTTASDALWVGVPLVTCTGQSLYARVAASLLHAIGLPELITENLGDYESLALALARDPARLSALKRKLEAARTSAPLFDTKRFTRNIEAAFTGMREDWLRGKKPDGISY